MEHLYVKSDNPSCIGFFRYLAKKQTYRQTELKTLPSECHQLG